jgi:hypothetical protein
MSVENVSAYLNEAPFRSSIIGQAPSLTTSIRQGWKGLCRDKHSGLLQKFVNYGCKRFNRIGPSAPFKLRVFVPADILLLPSGSKIAQAKKQGPKL